MLAPVNWIRRTRLRALLARQLENWDDVWSAYERGATVPVLRFRDGRAFHHGPRDAPVFLFLEIFANRCYSRLSPGHVDGAIVDVGANIGAFTLEAAARYPGSPVHAYEPDPASREVLRQNVAANGLERRVTIWPEAVAASDGVIEFHPAAASLESGTRAGSHAPIQARAVSLATVLARLGGRAGLLKIDAEGSEVEILESAAAPCARHIVGEFHPWLVEHAETRLRAALSRAFDVQFVVSRRCGTMFAASARSTGGC
jgi:FkbM family methyltransferase